MISPDVITIHCSPFPAGGMASLVVAIPGHPGYREFFKGHPENLGETALKLLRRVANDYAALLAKSSTTHETPEVFDPAPKLREDLLWLRRDLDAVTEERDKLRTALEAEKTRPTPKEDKTVNLGSVEVSLSDFKEAVAEYETDRALRKDDLLRSALRVLADYV